MQYKRQ